ncbi:dihydroorotate dehydrogenase electron transfer subunit [Caldanaerobius polysaccharolyticus]|uniref:dihydroorotate dehydrogenase electron transfer subunit n=1 Tax=Caldanaerobius polysaccharolyticus TaxID=44256 RepID=UPI00047B03A7|nr:dihydroorotate dehydrogenase electron transfer subunit [Caldanaerobius polysaccharolyticus]
MTCRVLFNNLIARDIYRLAFSCADIARSASPGQFVHVKVNDTSHILRRPFSVSDVIGDVVYIVYQIRGAGTRALSQLKPGDEIDVIGPLGRGFDVDKVKDKALVVGGGLGIAPMVYLAKTLGEKARIFLGYKNQLFLLDEFNSPIVSIESGEYDYKGLITELVEGYLKQCEFTPDIIYACGPVGMLKSIRALSQRYRIPCEISLEERMGCGIGACLVCSCKITSGESWHYKRVCADGPVFTADEVIFDD